MPPESSSLAEQIAQHLPYLRRYPRALTGSQTSGDTYAAATLEAILNAPATLDGNDDPKIALFQTFHAIWSSAVAQIASDETGLLATMQNRMEGLTRGAREALLLNTIEELPAGSVGRIMGLPPEEVDHLIGVARRELAGMQAGRVMIIEGEAIIAMDLEGIVGDIGHDVVGVARTADRAVEMGRGTKPDLVLADIHLADNSSGIDAVNTLMEDFPSLPVIFITAYPERLLTGERPEPAFLTSKPYNEAQVRPAVSQALFFASTETLSA